MITVLVVAIMLIEDSAPYSNAWYFALFPAFGADIAIRAKQFKTIVGSLMKGTADGMKDWQEKRIKQATAGFGPRIKKH
jgi:hypothetical protein